MLTVEDKMQTRDNLQLQGFLDLKYHKNKHKVFQLQMLQNMLNLMQSKHVQIL